MGAQKVARIAHLYRDLELKYEKICPFLSQKQVHYEYLRLATVKCEATFARSTDKKLVLCNSFVNSRIESNYSAKYSDNFDR
jgi:hypothetical protein